MCSSDLFLLVRRLTGASLAAVFSGFAFGFAGPMLGNMGHFNQLHAVAWAPLFLYGLQRIREDRYRSGAAVAAPAFALMWLAGHPQLPVYVSYVAAAFVVGSLLLDRPDSTVARARLGWCAAAVGVGAGLAAISVIPTIELTQYSSRAEASWDLYTGRAVPPWQMLSLLFPFAFGLWADHGRSVGYFGDGAAGENLAYVGQVTVLLAVCSWWTPGPNRREARFWAGLGVLALVLAVGAATPVGTLFYYVPGFARFRMPSRHLIVAALCMAVAAGYAMAGLADVRPGPVLRRVALRVLLVGLAVFVVFAWVTPRVATLLAQNRAYVAWAVGWPVAMALATALVAAIIGGVRGTVAPRLLGVLLVVVLVGDLTAVHYRVPGPGVRLIYADVPQSDAVPKPRIVALRADLQRTGERVIAVDGTHDPFLLPNLTRPWHVPAAGGSGPLGIQRYVGLFAMGGPGDVAVDVLRAPHQALDLFAVRYALAPEQGSHGDALRAEPGRWTLVDRLQFDPDDPDSRYELYRNASARPRAWCVGRVARIADEQAAEVIRTSKMPDGTAFDASEAVLASTTALADWTATAHEPACTVQPVGTQHTAYRTTSTSQSILVFSEVFYPWWRASVDGAPAPLSRVNATMLGLSLPAGAHSVRLSLRPTSLWIGAACTALSAIAWLAMVTEAFRRDT